MRLVDTHCHLDFPDYDADLAEVLERAKKEGIIRVIVPGTNIKSSEKAAEIAGKNPMVFAAAGIHPHEADNINLSDVSRLRGIAIGYDKIVAIGEVGLDNYKHYSSAENQEKLFRRCLKIACELDLPVIIHNRNAGAKLLNILKEFTPPGIRGVVHCFSGDTDLVKELLALGIYVSFAGNITFKKTNKLFNTLKSVPPERLLLETDSPFISPEPLRGKRNEPAYIRYLLDVYSEAYKLSPEDVARITTHNANELFHLGIKDRSAIAYPIRDSLYLNITNRCTNRCTFCMRGYSNYVKGHNLKLEAEPTAGDIISDMGDISKYKEVVFCGYGEPTLRLETIIKIASYVKEKGGRVRLTTNGQGNLINGCSIAEKLKDIIDRVSVSLNAADAEGYDRLCRSVFGKKAYDSILSFIEECKARGMEVEVTCLDMIGEEAITICRRKAKKMGAEFRLRRLNVVG